MADQSTAGARFDDYLGRLGEAVGHADRLEPLRAYLTGLLLPGDRKSVEPMAARVDPRHASARHQSMHHFVAAAPWDDHEVLGVAVDHALLQMERHAPVGAWVVDDTGFPKKGTHSVGVLHQYCGALGKEDSCQVVLTVSLVNATMSMPAAYRLYLPQSWAEDPARRREAGVPQEVVFRTKWELALEEIRRLLSEDLPPAPVVADAGYGDVHGFREGLGALGLSYAVAVKPQTTLWPPGTGPLLAAQRPRPSRGPTPRRLGRDADHRPYSARDIALSLAPEDWKTVRWRDGTKGRMRARFAALRVRSAYKDDEREELWPEQWLLVERPGNGGEPFYYWLSTLPEDADLQDLVGLVKLRWRIERDYEELKSELGIDHYEGRGWRGFHHHGVLCIAAYAFLAAERARLSPPQALAFLHAPAVPRGFRPRGAALAGGAP